VIVLSITLGLGLLILCFSLWFLAESNPHLPSLRNPHTGAPSDGMTHENQAISGTHLSERQEVSVPEPNGAIPSTLQGCLLGPYDAPLIGKPYKRVVPLDSDVPVSVTDHQGKWRVPFDDAAYEIEILFEIDSGCSVAFHIISPRAETDYRLRCGRLAQVEAKTIGLPIDASWDLSTRPVFSEESGAADRVIATEALGFATARYSVTSGYWDDLSALHAQMIWSVRDVVLTAVTSAEGFTFEPAVCQITVPTSVGFSAVRKPDSLEVRCLTNNGELCMEDGIAMLQHPSGQSWQRPISGGTAYFQEGRMIRDLPADRDAVLGLRLDTGHSYVGTVVAGTVRPGGVLDVSISRFSAPITLSGAMMHRIAAVWLQSTSGYAYELATNLQAMSASRMEGYSVRPSGIGVVSIRGGWQRMWLIRDDGAVSMRLPGEDERIEWPNSGTRVIRLFDGVELGDYVYRVSVDLPCVDESSIPVRARFMGGRVKREDLHGKSISVCTQLGRVYRITRQLIGDMEPRYLPEIVITGR
jgi:hypothetical protein